MRWASLNASPRGRRLWAFVVPLLISGCGTVGTQFDQPGIAYTHLERIVPRPLQIHVLRIDLANTDLVPAVDVAADPDADGPAETALVSPLDHAARGNFLAGVNANPWGMVPAPLPGEGPRYIAGASCDISGWVVADGVQRSSPQGGHWSFWMDADGTPHIGSVAAPTANARIAVAGFGGLLNNGQILPAPSDQRHPRTALGLDRDARTLILAVVDGRQPGTSEGMSDRELAELMLELGCWDALNLDGGGSSIMVLRGRDGEPRIVNRPSDKAGPRPIPVLFGVRAQRLKR